MKKLITPMVLALSLLISTSAFAHEVKSGDTMGKIAEEHNIPLRELSKANPQIKNINLIYVGETINTDYMERETVEPPKVVTERSYSTPTPTPQPVVDDSVTEMTVTATAYCNGCSGVTRTGIDLRSNPNQKVIAVDPNVIPL